ncbi:hypothetical protein RJ640_024105, partial [Escallonia rubra]
MADTTTAATIATTAPDTATATSISTSTATSTVPPPDTKPPDAKPPEAKFSWADEPDDEPEPEPEPSTSDDSLNLQSLAIDDSKSSINRFLDDPDDSNIQAVTSGDTPYTSAKTFEDLNLSPELLKGLYVEMKFDRPSKIQGVSLPMILTPPYKNLIAQAHNGSGKTTCFVLGMLSRVDPRLAAPQALCICPTRELANQNMEVLKRMGKYTGITAECAVPADSRDPTSRSRRPPVTAQVVIGTPGTINRWMTARTLGMSCMKVLVFDEADHMLAESGFKEDSLRIMKTIVKFNPDCQ